MGKEHHNNHFNTENFHQTKLSDQRFYSKKEMFPRVKPIGWDESICPYITKNTRIYEIFYDDNNSDHDSQMKKCILLPGPDTWVRDNEHYIHKINGFPLHFLRFLFCDVELHAQVQSQHKANQHDDRKTVVNINEQLVINFGAINTHNRHQHRHNAEVG